MIPERIRILGYKVYGKNFRFYGPYVRKSDERKFVILYDGVKRSAKLLSRFKIDYQ